MNLLMKWTCLHVSVCVLTFIGQLLALGNQLSQQLTVERWINCTVNASFIIITAATVSLRMMPFN